MTISEAMDITRSLCGKPDVDPLLLRFAMDEGRREIERLGNYYWMAQKIALNLFEDVQEYSITTASGNGFDLSDFKIHRYAFMKAESASDDSDVEWYKLPIGSHSDAMDVAQSDDEGRPEAASIENTTFFCYPTPDQVYDLQFFYFGWTTNASDITDTDELFTRWPMMIIAAALSVLVPLVTKNKEDAAFWLKMRDDEIEKAKDFTNKRLGEPANQMSASEAAKILQAQVGQ